MIAGNASQAQAWPAIGSRRALRAAVPLLALGIAWWIGGIAMEGLAWAQIVAYALIQLVIAAASSGRHSQWALLAGGGLLVDIVFSVAVLSQASAFGPVFFPLYLLVALRALSVYRRTPAATIIPFVLGPAYLFTTATQLSAPSSLEQALQWLLLLGSLAFGAIGIWTSTSFVRSNQQLKQELRDAHSAADLRVAQLEQTANHLRTRMREQHALEEGLRVITSSLSLDEVLNQIVDSTMQMFGPARVHGVALSLPSGDRFDHRAFALSDVLPAALADTLAARVMQQHVPLIVADLRQDQQIAAVAPSEVNSALSVPLFVGEGGPRGALTVVSAGRGSFSSGDVRHLTAFAIQAGIAIQNAELHSRMRQQQQLLSAVVRDITDGLVVLDAQSQVVLTNPLGRKQLDGSASVLREQIVALADNMRVEGKQLLTREIRDGDEQSDDTRTYQALASLVRQHGSDEPLVAIVLHDITAQKLEEHRRTEFISMVAHELRNPLNSMNGFVKIVLQGRAGALAPMQQEFLGIVDEQIELLKGRISELLEYNRLEAGKLALNPQWGDLPLLITGTITRLNLQAQNAGLVLRNEVDPGLPECYFDSERIGQVLTNLIENAIKATPPGGTIFVRSEEHDNEVWLRVYDTGVGIPPDEQNKIFEAFYRAHDRTSSKGNHLGLGLAICQQIVEGHRGRIWVESEQGRGSCFSFALPLIGDEPERERAMGE